MQKTVSAKVQNRVLHFGRQANGRRRLCPAPSLAVLLFCITLPSQTESRSINKFNVALFECLESIDCSVVIIFSKTNFQRLTWYRRRTCVCAFQVSKGIACGCIIRSNTGSVSISALKRGNAVVPTIYSG